MTWGEQNLSIDSNLTYQKRMEQYTKTVEGYEISNAILRDKLSEIENLVQEYFEFRKNGDDPDSIYYLEDILEIVKE